MDDIEYLIFKPPGGSKAPTNWDRSHCAIKGEELLQNKEKICF